LFVYLNLQNNFKFEIINTSMDNSFHHSNEDEEDGSVILEPNSPVKIFREQSIPLITFNNETNSKQNNSS